MKTRILALAAIAVMATAAVAVADTNKFSTKLKSRGGTELGTLSFKIKTNSKGNATKVTSVKVKNLRTFCGNDDGSFDGSPVDASLGSAKVTKFKLSTGTTYRFSLSKTVSGRKWNVSGELKSRKGRSVKNGAVSVRYDVANGSCSSDAEYTAKRK